MLPSIFIGHGAPTIIFDENKYTAALKNYAAGIKRPKGILIFSAHWESPIQCIGGARNYKMIYDFYGFPDEMYRIIYPASGDKQLSEKVQAAFDKAHIPCKIDAHRGIDHGAWTMLKLLYPMGDIPIVTLSLNTKLTPAEQYKIGECLAPLREEDYLIIGSGGIVHNLGRVKLYGSEQPDQWALDFNDWIKDKVIQWNLEELFQYETLAPHSHLAVPRNEHFINLLLAMGAGHEKKKAARLESIIQYSNLSLDLWEFE